MQLWNDFVDWLGSEDGWRILSSVVFPLLAIIVAGFIAAMIGRGSTRRLLQHHDREQRVSTVASLIGAARRASKWNLLSAPEQQHAEHLAHDADISTRLLPLPGATMTADWAAHEIAEMKKNSVSFSFQAEQSLLDFRDRLVEWQSKPSRAKKLFKADLDLWAYESAQEDKGLVEKQQEWAKQQVATETGPVSTVPAYPHTDGLKPISWGTQDTSEAQVPVAPVPVAQTPAVTAPAVAYHASPVTPATTNQDALPRSGFGMPAATSPTSAPSPDAHSVDSAEQPETPTPVSAQTVRQRVLPDFNDDDDLR